jgi:hypothetical protein
VGAGGVGAVTIRFAGLLVVFSLLMSAAAAEAECSWSVRWPIDERIWAIPWGSVPHSGFRVKRECEAVIQSMLQEAIRGQALLVEMPACVCVLGRDDWALTLHRFTGHYRSFPE